MRLNNYFTLLTFSLLLFSSCLPKILEEPIITPQEDEYSGYWYIDNERTESAFTRRFESSGSYLYAQSERIDSISEITHLLEIHYGGGLPSNGIYTIVENDDDLDITNKEVFITMYNGLTRTRYHSTGNTETASMSIQDNGRMKVTVPVITLTKEYGDGKETIEFSCEIIEIED